VRPRWASRAHACTPRLGGKKKNPSARRTENFRTLAALARQGSFFFFFPLDPFRDDMSLHADMLDAHAAPQPSPIRGVGRWGRDHTIEIVQIVFEGQRPEARGETREIVLGRTGVDLPRRSQATSAGDRPWRSPGVSRGAHGRGWVRSCVRTGAAAALVEAGCAHRHADLVRERSSITATKRMWRLLVPARCCTISAARDLEEAQVVAAVDVEQGPCALHRLQTAGFEIAFLRPPRRGSRRWRAEPMSDEPRRP